MQLKLLTMVINVEKSVVDFVADWRLTLRIPSLGQRWFEFSRRKLGRNIAVLVS